MDFAVIILIAIGLAMDASAVSLGVGTTPLSRSWRVLFRLAFHFGLFQGLMTFLGWLAGSTIASLIANVDHWIAMGLLSFVGVRMIVEGMKKAEDESRKGDPSRGGSLIMLCIATSLDAMAVGLSLAMLDVSILGASLVIGVVTLLLSALAFGLGRFLGTTFGKRMEVVGGCILIFIGARILVTHLFNIA
jgi:manganese efflux pump family protein